MTEDETPPTEAEAREAESLRLALEDRAGPGRDPAPIEDALATAWLLRSASATGIGEPGARSVPEKAWPRASWRARGRAAAAAAAVIATVAAFVAGRPRAPATLPSPPAQLLRAGLAAARPGSQAELARADAEMAAYRERVFERLRDVYGRTR